MDSLYQVLNEDAVRAMTEDLVAAAQIPDVSHAFGETMGPVEIFWRGLSLAGEVPVQGELVIALGQDDDDFTVTESGCTFIVVGHLWRYQIALQPYMHGGAVQWRLSRHILVDPTDGTAPERETSSCDCIDEGISGGRRTLEGAVNLFGAMLEPVAATLWELAADGPTAGLVFGNWALLEALDRIHPTPERRPPPATDGVADEVIGIRISDGKAVVRAVERD